MRRLLTSISVAAMLAFSAAPALADDAPAKGDDAKAKIELPPMSPDKSVDQVVNVDGHTLRYKARVGHIDVQNDKGKVIGQVVYTAYTVPNTRYARPVTFAFNGGPGAASVFLNMGAIGPKHVSFEVQGDSPSDPAVLHDNPNTWLGFTDLVFIDPIGTGFSRSLEEPEATAKDFYDAKTDIQYLSRVVYDWLVKNGRLTSNKYLIGESYGGFRVPKLAYNLQSRMGVGVAGIVMVSPYLDPAATGEETALSPLPWMIDLPAMAAGHFERQGGIDPQKMAEVENYTRTQFVTDFLAGTDNKEATDRLSAHVAELTGLDPTLVRQLNGRVDIRTYLREIRRSTGQVGSVYDFERDCLGPVPGFGRTQVQRPAARWDHGSDDERRCRFHHQSGRLEGRRTLRDPFVRREQSLEERRYRLAGHRPPQGDRQRSQDGGDDRPRLGRSFLPLLWIEAHHRPDAAGGAVPENSAARLSGRAHVLRSAGQRLCVQARCDASLRRALNSRGSRISRAPISPAATAQTMYQPGATAFSVHRINSFRTTCVLPPKMAIASA